MRQGWGRRIAGVGAIIVLALVVLTVLSFEPDPLRVGLLVALVAALLRLVGDSMAATRPDAVLWAVEAEAPVRPVGEDARLAVLVRILTQHQVARVPDSALLDRLRGLADRRLEQRYGVRRELDPRRAADLLGPGLTQVLAERPGRRLSLSEIEQHLRRIEEL